MIYLPHHDDRWRLITPHSTALRRLWGWGHTVQKIIAASEPSPRDSSDLVVASDYGGEHKGATHNVYCYLILRGGLREWIPLVERLRKDLPDGRRMAYKRLDDRSRQNVLVPFLQAASDLDGHLVAIAVDKKKKWLTTAPGEIDDLIGALSLKTKWNPRSLESMLRKVHFVAIFLSLWSRPHTNLTWLTDQDEFVANDRRHDDTLAAAARFSSFYIQHPMGILAFDTTASDTDGHFESLCAIPDLAAGMLSDVSSRLRNRTWETGLERLEEELPWKVDLLADWFWDANMRLRKTLISIDVCDVQYSVRKISAFKLPLEPVPD